MIYSFFGKKKWRKPHRTQESNTSAKFYLTNFSSKIRTYKLHLKLFMLDSRSDLRDRKDLRHRTTMSFASQGALDNNCPLASQGALSGGFFFGCCQRHD
jgi:hypothetical protein